MNKLTPIDYIENSLSYQPKIILSWITQGIVINNTRYSIKEFRIKEDGKLYAVIAEDKYNSDYFEVQLSPDEETLKQILASIAEKEQTLESTRNTIAINHGSNGTSNKTKVDTNPQKVLEHENLISDSEYITLQHQTGESTTHIQAVKLKEKLDDLEQNKQDVLVSGNGITIQGQTISVTGGGGGGSTPSIQDFEIASGELYAIKYSVEIAGGTFKTFVFDCLTETSEHVISGQLKEELEQHISSGSSISNGAISITNDGTDLKFINSASQGAGQQATFTFYTPPTGDGVGGIEIV